MLPWTMAQLNTFLDKAEADRLAALFLLAIHSGARESELLALLWEDIDWEHNCIHITKQLQTGKNPLKKGDKTSTKIVPPKSDSGERTVHLAPEAMEALRRHRQAMELECKTGPATVKLKTVLVTREGDKDWKQTTISGRQLYPNSGVFVGVFGGWVSRNNLLTREFYSMLKAAELPRIVNPLPAAGQRSTPTAAKPAACTKAPQPTEAAC